LIPGAFTVLFLSLRLEEIMSVEQFRTEISTSKRFKFGENWKKFLSSINDERIKQAEISLKTMLEVESLEGKSFLDVGSGSGLFSLAARNLGAKVVSFDFDESCVWCTMELKNRYRDGDTSWTVMQGSVLDNAFLKTLGDFDYVYSWGVLHHTGDMWRALDNVIEFVKLNGYLFIALYNYQQFASSYWTFVKRTYNSYRVTRPFWILLHFLYPSLPSIVLKFIQNRKPTTRGMTIWHDLIDWLGGYPFEVSTPKEIFDFYKDNGFTLTQLKTVGGKLGCNEYVFRLDHKKELK
jgi:2-polyprenyl-3-methyl-5-hydroxy-6-metoxy-1,4-benzoquinol methylase